MGYHPKTRSRAYREGWQGRRRTYKCRDCGNKFQVDTLDPLPEDQRICYFCNVEKGNTVNPYFYGIKPKEEIKT